MCLDYNLFDDDSQIAQLRIKTDFCVELPVRLGMFLDNAFCFLSILMSRSCAVVFAQASSSSCKNARDEKTQTNIH